MARKAISNTDLGRRLTDVREAAGYRSRKALADDLKMNAETLGGYERGDTVPDYAFLSLYREKFGINLNWLITGEGDMFFATSPSKSSIPAWLNDIDFSILPFYDIEASAGPGRVPAHELLSGVVAFDRNLLRALGATPDRCEVIWAQGDSMQPTIPDGSLLVVDPTQTDVRNGHIMVISVGDDLLVKRIRRRLDGLIDLISDNPAYTPETIGRDTIQQLRVIGRVIYFCRAP